MALPACDVIVRELPLSSDTRQASLFVSGLRDSMARVVRPCVVLDCSRVRRIDNTFLHLLLCCLEEAMKRNGDVRLAGVPEAARPALESRGLDRLFRSFPTTSQAAQSFRRPAAGPTVLAAVPESTSYRSARAA